MTADEEYVLTLNGKRIGAGAFEPGAPLDVYEVGPLLLPGGNRLMVELRSGRGAGGLLASLVDEATGRQIVGTGEDWRIFPHHELGLVRGWLPLRARRAGVPLGVSADRPLGRAAGGLAPGRCSARRSARACRPPRCVRSPSPPAWRDGRSPGSPILYDWGRTVEGFLTLELPAGKDQGAALLFTGEAPPDPLTARPTAAVLIVPGRRDWMDARPRRFRYALLVGLEGPAAAAVQPVPAGAVRTPRPLADRVFGIQGAAATNAGGGRSLEQTPELPGRRWAERTLARAWPRPRTPRPSR